MPKATKFSKKMSKLVVLMEKYKKKLIFIYGIRITFVKVNPF